MSELETPPPAEKPGQPPKRPRTAPIAPGLWIWILIIFGVTVLLMFGQGYAESDMVEYGVILDQLVHEDNIDTLAITPTKLIGKFKKATEAEKLPEPVRRRMAKGDLTFTAYAPATGEERALLQTHLLAKNVSHWTLSNDAFSWLMPTLTFIVPLAIIGAFLVFIIPKMRDPFGGGMIGGYIKSNAKKYDKDKGRVSFDDVANMEAAKGELREIVDFLRSPEKFAKLGGQVPKGVLLVGPPGTGKTLLTRAVAGEAGVPFYNINGSEFVQLFVGVGASRVRELFKTAKENAPSILFIDEIDSVGRIRGPGMGGGHDGEREQTLNQILSEMDGFMPNESVIVIAATNRPDVLDPALLRPGRFDRHVTIDRPTWQGRMAILKVHTRDKPLSDNVNLERIARSMIGMTGADLRNLANEAALLATREGKDKIEHVDFERAADRVIIGAKREEILTEEEKHRTAVHEAGHTITAWLEPKADALVKVSIIPRGRSLGVTRMMPNEDRMDRSRSELEARLAVAMGGRAADKLVFNEPFAGAQQDIQHATLMARTMVARLGMSERLGPVAYNVSEESFLGHDFPEPRDFSEASAELIDQEVRRILQEADERAFKHMESHRPELERLVKTLLQREELNKEEIETVLTNGELPPVVPVV